MKFLVKIRYLNHSDVILPALDCLAKTFTSGRKNKRILETERISEPIYHITRTIKLRSQKLKESSRSLKLKKARNLVKV